MNCSKCNAELSEDNLPILAKTGIFKGWWTLFRGCHHCFGAHKGDHGIYLECRCLNCQRVVIVQHDKWTHKPCTCGRIFCTDKCFQSFYNKMAKPAKPQANCAVCGAEITDQRRDAKTCSSKCRQKRYRVANKKRAKISGSSENVFV